ncbi:glycoside hydrolase family 3 C-terminal domain-containing protein [Pedobacter sp. SD-b]|uniref:Glycoside hydrolase family 3 C-terminal domain-containing protein n=1 Tax=Pedobacter segetis TaxID=2793069 RepID=A0ABS1BMM0_9SPHI|nr:glycoside hydrolase family 3 C-terminal domain-containing protein [Pedobacter segetis]MBK0384140.1 glycoside hydrolase family 3 C-terminal domain-containing protein [Pedobacter segetis]
MKLKTVFFVAVISTVFAVPSFSQQKENPQIEKKIKTLINQMTLEEKIGIIHASSSFTSGGVPRLGIPELVMSDGPHGVRPEHGRDWVLDKGVDDAGTYLPTGINLASTWNPKLGYQYGAVLGSEARYRGKDMILGPGVNIIRSPLNGRNFEYLSEDPFLASQMAVGYIKGVQNQGVSACVKHFAANNEEADRNTVDVRMSERALREIYLPAFKAAVKQGNVYAVMGSYNKFRGQFATHNDYLVNKILKGEWGFKGILLSDWGAVHNTKQALYNGTDLEMGTDLRLMNNSVSQSDASGKALSKSIYDQFFMADSALNLIKEGKVPIAVIDEKVTRILRLMFDIKMIGSNDRPVGVYNSPEHQQVALKVAEEGIVLLKNNQNLLPLNKSIKSIAVIGENAARENAMGGGSSQVKAKYEITPLQGLKNLLGTNTNITYARGYKIDKKQKADDELIAEAVKAAKNADVAIVYCGWTHGYDYNQWGDNAFDAEGVDKPNMNMPFEQDKLLTAVLAANPKTIIVLMGGGPVDMSKWINQAPAIIQGWYPGMEGGNALAKIIFGDVNPSGKLPMTFPKVLEDVPAHKLGEFHGTNGIVNYKDDIFVGYRYYETFNVKPQFAFGHGLSYTNFNYDDARIKAKGGNLEIKVKIKNTGKVDGAEVVQVYVKKPGTIKLPNEELKSFEKVFLKAGESKKIVLEIPKEDLRYYDEDKKAWILGAGKVNVMIGNASDDIKIKKEIEL